MTTLQELMLVYQQEMKKGAIQQAYRGLMEYLLSLKNHFQTRHPEFSVPGTFYAGYMDMSYFAIVPEDLKQRGLKIALVYLHETGRFEVWLAGVNKSAQREYWEIIRRAGWNKYRLVPELADADAVLEHSVSARPDFSDLDALTEEIEKETLAFIGDVRAFLAGV